MFSPAAKRWSTRRASAAAAPPKEWPKITVFWVSRRGSEMLLEKDLSGEDSASRTKRASATRTLRSCGSPSGMEMLPA